MGLLLINADVRTLDDRNPRADALLARDGVIVGVGTASDLAPREGDRVVDLGGAVVIPGIVDAHTHPTAVAKSAWHVALPETHDVDEILAFVREYGERHPVEEAPYLYFEYYPTTLFGDGAPTAALLDTAISDRPVLLQDGGDHASWVNTRMLELLGVTADTPDPVPGMVYFARDADGIPTGHVFERAYIPHLDRMYDAIGWRPPEDLDADIVAPVLSFWTEHGVTTLLDAIIETDRDLAAIAELDRAGRLPMLVEGAVRFESREELPAAIARARDLDRRFGSPRIRVRTLKLFLDGTNELGNSAVLEPLLAGDHGLGAIRMEADDLAACLVEIDRAGLDLHIHVVGDRGFRTACDAVEIARERVGAGWRAQVTLAHCELVDPADMDRPAELGIFVNWTNHWSGGYFGEEARTFLGDERWSRMYAFRRIADAGARVTFSSDVVTHAELHRADPFFGMQVAATRVDPEAPLDPERFPGSVRPSADSALDVDLLLRGSTIDAARQLRLDDRVGSLEPGKMANLVVLSADPAATDPAELGGIRATAVVFGGELVAGAFPGDDADA